jgi:hypothetical protein
VQNWHQFSHSPKTISQFLNIDILFNNFVGGKFVRRFHNQNFQINCAVYITLCFFQMLFYWQFSKNSMEFWIENRGHFELLLLQFRAFLNKWQTIFIGLFFPNFLSYFPWDFFCFSRAFQFRGKYNVFRFQSIHKSLTISSIFF